MSVATGIALAQDRGEWRVESSCKDTDPDLFFPVGTTGPAIEQIEAAKAVCGICPVQSQCLEFALATNQDSGVWGGTSEDERRRLRRQWLARQRRAQLARRPPSELRSAPSCARQSVLRAPGRRTAPPSRHP